MYRSVWKKRILAALLMLALLVSVSACADKPSRSELQGRLDADVTHQDGEIPAEESTPDEPLTDAPTQTADPLETTPSEPAQSPESFEPVEPETPDESGGLPTDEELHDLLLTMDTNLSFGLNTFTFRSASELTNTELFLTFLLRTPYDALNRCWDADAQSFYFTEDTITSELSKYYKDFYFDIRQNSEYSDDARAIVTPTAPGFGGGWLDLVIEEKTMEDDILTVTAAFYPFAADVFAPENCKLRKVYTLERYDGGWYFLSAIEQPMTECDEPETAALLLTMLRRAQLVNISEDEQQQYTRQAGYKEAYLAYQQYFTEHAAEFAAYAEAEGSWMCFYLLEGGLSCIIYADGLDEAQLLYRPSSGVTIVSGLVLPA